MFYATLNLNLNYLLDNSCFNALNYLLQQHIVCIGFLDQIVKLGGYDCHVIEQKTHVKCEISEAHRTCSI